MFKEKLRTARKSSGFTQRALAESLGLTERAYQHYELGTREPNIETLVKLSLILDISLDELLCREEFRSSLEAVSDEC